MDAVDPRQLPAPSTARRPIGEYHGDDARCLGEIQRGRARVKRLQDPVEPLGVLRQRVRPSPAGTEDWENIIKGLLK
jgi:hypothetical protein